MVLYPWYRWDLDALTEQALHDNTPDLAIKYSDWENKPPTHRMRVLTAACLRGRVDLIDVLLDAGATMTAGDLWELVSLDTSYGTVQHLLARGVPHDHYCLKRAIRHANWPLVHLMLEYGADFTTPCYANPTVYMAGMNKTSLLHVAAWQGVGWLVKDLLERGAEIELRDSQEMTPLMKACDIEGDYHNASSDAVYWLLKRGANVKAATTQGETALLLCIGESPRRTADGKDYTDYKREATRIDIALMLLRSGADPNIAAPNGATPLMFAARDNDILLAGALLRAGAHPEARTPQGETALDVARRWESAAVETLLQSHASGGTPPKRER